MSQPPILTTAPSSSWSSPSPPQTRVASFHESEKDMEAKGADQGDAHNAPAAAAVAAPPPAADAAPEGAMTELKGTSSRSPVVDPASKVVIPDGGARAWICVVGTFVTLFAGFGTVNSYGTFQEYYKQERLSNYSESLISLNGTIQLFLLYGLAGPVGKIFDAYGSAVLMPLGSFLMVFALFMLSLCQPGQAYQYFLCQAVLFGTGTSLCFSPALAVHGHWFSKRRGIALGITTSGSGLGGVIVPIILQRLLPRIGWGWSVRVIGFIVLALQVVACLCLRPNLPPKGMTKRDWLKVIDLDGWKDVRFASVTLGSFFIFYGIFIPFYYIESSAKSVGMDPELATYMLSIVNAAGIPSRLIIGVIADKVGPLNAMIPMLVISGVLPLAVWLPARGSGPIIAFSVLYGLASGCFVSLLPQYIARISPPNTYGARLGSVYAFISIANLVGSPTAGALVGNRDQTGFNHLIGFTAALLLGGTVAIVTGRILERRRVGGPPREMVLGGRFLKT